MSQLGCIYEAFKADGFEPRLEAFAFADGDDLSILLHPEVPECLWWFQFQKRLWPERVANAYWSPLGGRWVLR